MTALSFLEALSKADPGPVDVHVPAAGIKGKGPRSFREIVGKLSASDRKKRERRGEAFERLDEFDDIDKAAQPRALKAIDDANSHTPFPHDAAAFANLRQDQIPRFLGALTDAEKLETKTIRLGALTAMQDRVETAKVEGMRGKDLGDKLPVVVRMGGRSYIADGHHRLAAAWLDGATTADVRFKDLTAKDQALKAMSFTVPITKTDEAQNLVFGWASVIEENGEPVYDHQGHRISEDEMEKAFYRYAEEARVAGEMHDDYGEHIGKLVECMVFSKAKQEVLGIDLGKVGAWVGYRVSPAVFAKVKSGALKMLSIGGHGQLEDDE